VAAEGSTEERSVRAGVLPDHPRRQGRAAHRDRPREEP
jgi:hypothetical protein